MTTTFPRSIPLDNENTKSSVNSLSFDGLRSDKMSLTTDCDVSFSSTVAAEINFHDEMRNNPICRQDDFSVPILGYEIMESRSKFTVFKISVTCQSTGKSWLLFRRYTDFVRLSKKLRKIFPNTRISLPSKRWFGNNFDPSFLEERLAGLQKFHNTVMKNGELRQSPPVRKFFCFDDPPAESADEASDKSESIESEVDTLKQLLMEKENEVKHLTAEIELLKAQLSSLSDSSITENCKNKSTMANQDANNLQDLDLAQKAHISFHTS